MLKIKLKLQIHSSACSFSTDDIFLMKEISSNFMPSMGMTLVINDLEIELKINENIEEGGVTRVIFYPIKNELLVYIEDTELYKKGSDIGRLREIENEYIDLGWERSAER